MRAKYRRPYALNTVMQQSIKTAENGRLKNTQSVVLKRVEVKSDVVN